MVTYGGMSREPVTVPTSALIFKDVSVRGFWMTQWSKDHAGTPEQAEMFHDISNMYTEGILKAPVHKLVPFSKYKEGLANSVTIKGFTGLKYILDFQSQWLCHLENDLYNKYKENHENNELHGSEPFEKLIVAWLVKKK